MAYRRISTHAKYQNIQFTKVVERCQWPEELRWWSHRSSSQLSGTWSDHSSWSTEFSRIDSQPLCVKQPSQKNHHTRILSDRDEENNLPMSVAQAMWFIYFVPQRPSKLTPVLVLFRPAALESPQQTTVLGSCSPNKCIPACLLSMETVWSWRE